MKRTILLLAALFAVGAVAGQSRFSWATAVGAGISLSEPGSTPAVWRIAGFYEAGGRFSAGAGTGLSFYEKTLVPLFGEVRFRLSRPRRLTPYLGCAAGYAFAPDPEARGGLFLNPSLGFRFRTRRRIGFTLAAGYELQRLERLKTFRSDLFRAEFRERLCHHTVSLQAGIWF